MLNHIFANLNYADQMLLSARFRADDLPDRMVLQHTNGSAKRVYFLDSGLASVAYRANSRTPIQVGIVGFDGVAGPYAAFDGAYRHLTVQICLPGRGRSIEHSVLDELLAQSAGLRAALERSAAAFSAQLMSTVAASARGGIESRICRWLLMHHDRIDGDSLLVSHEIIAEMLGVRRPGVTEVLQKLTLSGLIKSKRRCVEICDRAGLNERAAEFYGAAESEHFRLTGWRAKPVAAPIDSVTTVDGPDRTQNAYSLPISR